MEKNPKISKIILNAGVGYVHTSSRRLARFSKYFGQVYKILWETF